MSLVTNVFRRGGSYYFRARVPERFRALLERRELWRSLRTGDPSIARQRASLVAQLTQRLWRTMDLMTTTDPAEQRAQTKALIDKWALEALDDDENNRVLPPAATYAAVIVRRRPFGIPDDTSETLSARALKTFQTLPPLDQEARLGTDGYLLEGPVSDRELRAAHLHQTLEGASQRHKEADEAAAGDQVAAILEAAGLSLERGSPAFVTATHQMMKAHVLVRGAINRRHVVRWRPDLDPDPAQAEVERLRPATSSASIEPDRGVQEDPRGRSDLLSVVAHDAVLERVGLAHMLPGRGREYEKAADLFVRWAGTDPFVQDVTVKQAGEFRQAIVGFPTHANKRPEYRNVSFADASAKAKSSGETATIGVTTVNGNYLTPLRSIFQWAIETGKITTNPFADVKVEAGKKAAGVVRRGFKPAEVVVLLRSPVFTGSKSASGEGLYQAGALRVDDWRYWLPTMSLFSGARLNELAGLHLVDFDEQDSMPLFRIRAFSPGQRIKSSAADRVVPVHNALIELGLIDRVRALRALGETQLFPTLKPGGNGYFSHTPSRFFGRLIDRLWADDPTLTFHGFRHAFITGMREARVPKEVRTCIVGHEDGDTHDSYGEEPFARLNEGVQSVVWPGLDLSSIRLPKTKS